MQKFSLNRDPIVNQLKKKTKNPFPSFSFTLITAPQPPPKNKTEIVKSESTLSHLGSPLEEQKRATVTLQGGRGRGKERVGRCI